MSACGSICDNTIPENSSSKSPSSVIDSLSPWNQIIALKPPVNHSFTEIFGELQSKENSNPLFSSSSPSSNVSEGYNGGQQDDKWGNNNEYQGSYHKRNDSFSSLNSESLQICTEGLGSESLDDVEDMKVDFSSPWLNHNKNDDNNNNYSYTNSDSYRMGEKMTGIGYSGYQYRKGKADGKTFPPPISCIGKTGKPCVCFQSYRQDGRFVLKEMRIPTHERLHASREDGRLRLCFAQPSDQDEDAAGEVIDNEDDEGAEEGVVGGKIEDEDKEDVEERKVETEVGDDVDKGH